MTERGRLIPALLVGAILLGMNTASWGAQGSWVGTLSRQTVAVSDRALDSDTIEPPPAATGTIDRVRWSFKTDAPLGTLRASLCQGSFCVPLRQTRGETTRFTGRPADQPFRFRFQMPPTPGRHGSVIVSEGQLIVDYHHQ